MKNNNFGFGLLEVMISVLLMSGISYLVLQQVSLFRDSQLKQNFDQKVSSLTGVLSTTLADPKACQDFVKDVKIGSVQSEGRSGQRSTRNLATGGSISENHSLDLPAGSLPVSSSGVPLPFKNGVEFIRGGKVKDVQLLSDGFKYFIRVTFEKTGFLGMSSSTVSKDIIIKGNLLASNNTLENCQAQEMFLSAEDLCQKLSTTQPKVAKWDQRNGNCVLEEQLINPPDSKGLPSTPVYIDKVGKIATKDLIGYKIKKCLCHNLRCSFKPDCDCNVTCPSGFKPDDVAKRMSATDIFNEENTALGFILDVDFVLVKLLVNDEKCMKVLKCYDVRPFSKDVDSVGGILNGP